jgi:transcription elongation factor Elf1
MGLLLMRDIHEIHEFQCPACKSESVLADNMKKQLIFICQHCGFREQVEHRYRTVPAPYFFISGKTLCLPNMLGKN